ncbi:hypothetical protein LSUE1_G008562 [Lachnellula suecica]|uniref:Myb-like domain-containing protein n=1 Tax=Lachnellula suecica TaxID=602035 RepID=A0A8T9C1J3_9HELO|nr:hypothetical protein LSUE1_G008562 [Lachnellula suecica]
MSSLGEPIYSIQPGRLLHNSHDLTPYSAVSSFNLPAHYDSTLITPVTMSEPTSVPAKSTATMSEKRIKLSPTSVSPTFQLFGDDDDFSTSRYNPPMKHKESSSDSAFPVSPYVCPEPFWGSYGVSATPGSAQTATPSPSMHHPSPNLHSAGGVSNGSRHSRQPTPAQTPTTYASHSSTPILIAPNPSSLRAATKQENGPYRQNSLQSNHSTPRSQGPPQGAFLDSMSQLQSAGRKRKSPESGYEGSALYYEETNDEERLLLQLTEDMQLPWKEVARRFNERTGKVMKVPALQMRKKRLLERIRVWTDTEERALTMAWEDYEKSRWDAISKGMLSHGCTDEWTKEAVQKKWNEMHPNAYQYPSTEYELLSRSRGLKRQRAWSEERESVGHSLHEVDTGMMLPAVSTVTMDQVRSRAMSDSSSQAEFHRQPAHMDFEQQRNQQRHRNSWDSRA